MKHIMLFMVFVCVILRVNAQFTLSGLVRDSNDEKLIGANVIIEGTMKGTSTNLDGQYFLNNVKEGKVEILVSYIGYETIHRTLNLNENKTLDFVLKPSLFISEDAIVRGIRASDKDPVPRTNIAKADFDKQNLGQDLPMLLSLTPSAVTTSDAGAGVGYTGIRIRGSDASRTNVTINGVPLNDAESQDVFWVDIPDFAENVDNIQIQRGVGSSTNGAGSFGATMNLQTTKFNLKPYAGYKSSAGSFNTFKNTFGLGSGLLDSRFTFDARVSLINSDGFIDRAFSNLQSYFVSVGFLSDINIVRLNAFGGTEKTYQAWNGIPKVKLNNDKAGILKYIEDNGLTGRDSVNILMSNPRRYNSFIYDNQTDNYQQNHYQVIYLHKFSNLLTFDGTLHYTRGFGYYEEYKPNQNLTDYNLSDVIIGTDTINKTDLIRRLWLNNDFYGGIFSLCYSNGKTDIILGGAVNEYYGRNYGQVIWAKYFSDGEIRHEWYNEKGIKYDMTVYLKINHQLSNNFSIYGDLQFRHINYKIEGLDQNLRDVGQTHLFNFFNPKAGATYKMNGNQSIYSFIGMSQKEPTRANYVDRKPGTPIPVSEKLFDFELGYKTVASNYEVCANYFMMYYINQLVLTGALNDVGDPLMRNMENSYRQGIELQGTVKISELIKWEANATLSANKIQKFDDSLGVFQDNGPILTVFDKEYKNVDIAFSPSWVAASNISILPLKDMAIKLQSKFVSKQYIDNTQSVDRMINDYFVNNLVINFELQSSYWKQLSLELVINNLFNVNYLTNGWVYRYLYNDKLYIIDGYFPQAGRNFLAGINIKF